MVDSVISRGLRTLKDDGVRTFVGESGKYLYNRPLLYQTVTALPKLPPTALVEYCQDRGTVIRTEADLSRLSYHRPVKIPSEVEPGVGYSERTTCVVPDGRIVGLRGLSLTPDGRAITDSVKKSTYLRSAVEESPHQFVGDAFFPRPVANGYRRFLDRWCHDYDLVVNMVTHGGRDANYGHWLSDYLLKLFHLEAYKRATGREPKLLVDVDPPVWMTDSLDLLGYGSDRRIEWDNSSARVATLVVPLASTTGVDSERSYSPVEFQWLRAKLLESVRTEDTDTPSRIYVSRQQYDSLRKVSNFDEIRPVLEEYDFTILRPEQHSFEEQVRLFADASVVVGCTGSGLWNVLFSRDTTLIELYTKHDTWKTAAAVLGHQFTRIVGDPVEEQEYDEKADSVDTELNTQIEISPAELERAIEAAVQ